MIIMSRQDQLAAMRARLEEQYEEHNRQLAELEESTDDAVAAFNNAALAIESRRALAEITRALRLIAEGRYGQCESCGLEIPVERLEIRPYARYCVQCQRERAA